MTWRDNSGIERGFIVERREVKEGREESYEAIALLDQNSTSYRDTNLPPERQFQYRVRSYNDLTFSTYTTSGAIMTIKLAVPSAPLGIYSRPQAGHQKDRCSGRDVNNRRANDIKVDSYRVADKCVES